MKEERWIALDEAGGDQGRGENVVRIPIQRKRDAAESERLEREVALAGDYVMTMIDDIAAAVSKSNARSELLAKRAVAALQRAEARIRELEARLAQAELRALTSDQLVHQLRDALREKFDRYAPPSSAA